MDSNLLNLAPSIALDTLSIIILLLSWWMLEYPAGYVPVNNQDHNQMEESRLKKLNIGTKISCFLLISLASTEFYLRSKDSNDIQWNLILQISYFLVLAICSHRLNYTLNAYAGGQIAVFMTLVLVIAELVLNLYQRFPFLAELPDILVLGKAIILFSTLLTYGLWDHVAELPTRPNLSKEAGASILSRLFFCWVSPLIILGNSKSLVLEDIWGLVDSDLSLNVTEHHKTTNDQERSLLWNLTQLSLPFAVYQGVCSLLSTFLTFANPYFLFRIIKAVQAQNVPKVVIILDLVLMFVMAAMQTLLLGQVYFIGRRFGLRARVAIIDQIYQKSLKRAHIASNSDEESASSGKIVNLMSVDAERINVFLSYYHDIYIRIPISILLAVGSLFLIMGWSAMVGVFLSFLLAWLSFALGKWVMNLQTNLLKSTDKRVGAMNELLNGIKIIKFFAWESYFQSKVDLIRKEELENLVKLWGGRLLFSTIGTGSGVLIALGTFAAYTLLSGSVLDAATAFTAISLLRVVSQHLTNLPYLVMIAFNAFVSAERVEEFLAEQNIDSLSNSGGSMVVEENSTIIGFRDASFVYHSCDSQHSKFKLRTLNLSFPVNGLTLICGSTGSGKSSLLLAFLGELKCIEGRILKPEISHQIDKKTGLSKTISYVAQTAWLLNATIRDNILFGQEYDRVRYEAVIQGCALKKDFDIFEGGDLTEVG